MFLQTPTQFRSVKKTMATDKDAGQEETGEREKQRVTDHFGFEYKEEEQEFH